MKDIIKKNQIVLFTVALMLVVAGYMNYTVNTRNLLKTATTIDTEKYAEIGDAKFVSGELYLENEETNSSVNNNEELETNSKISSNEELEKNSSLDNSKELETNSAINKESVAVEQYFVQSRIDREKMYSQIVESYEKILNSENVSEEQKRIAENEIVNINNKKNAIMISENLIKNKGFNDVIIFVNDRSINVIVRMDKLEQEQVAQIQNIIQREMNAQIEDIHISNK